MGTLGDGSNGLEEPEAMKNGDNSTKDVRSI